MLPFIKGDTTIKLPLRLQEMRVLFYIPNIIGYLRLVLLLLVLFIALSQPKLTFWIYFFCANLDALDGYLARRLQQISQFGTMLDYAIDRASDVLLFMILTMIYPHAWIFFCLMLMLDVFSHFCQLYSTVFLKGESHKKIGKNQGAILNAYYSNRTVLYFTCAFHDLWLASLYLYHFFPTPAILALVLFFLPGFVFKSIIHLLQIFSVFNDMVRNEPLPPQ